MYWLITGAYEGYMVRTYLQKKQRFSRRLLKQMIHGDGAVWVNNEETTTKHVLQSGDTLCITLPNETKGAMMTPEPIPLDIVYEDDALLVINKPAGRVTMPSQVHPTGTIANGVLAHYEKQGLPYTFHIVTRLDRNTSGVMLVAKHRWSHSLLAEAQKNGMVERRYYAVIEGHLAKKSGTIDAPIGRKDGSIIERMVRQDGKKALTHYRVIKEMASHTLVSVRLGTGRTHQIRVHFAHIGHPLAGDDLYGGSTTTFNRQALHCHQLAFAHPMTSDNVTFTAELTSDFDGSPC